MLSYRHDAIAELLKNRGLTAYQFGKQIGKSKQAVSQLLSGVRKPRIDTLCDICNVYDMPITYFFEERSE